MWRGRLGRLATILLGAGTLLAGCGQPPANGPVPVVSTPGAPSPQPTGGVSVSSPSRTGSPVAPSAPPPEPCTARVAQLSQAELIGQVFMVGVPSSGLPDGTARSLRRTRAGSAILLGNTTAGVPRVRRVTDEVRDAARPPDRVSTLLAADQEGGQVQRLRGRGFSDMPSARAQADLSPGELARRARGWGGELRAAGIDANLAPVADVVPARLEAVNQPIGVLRRGFGPDPAVVASHARAVVTGMDQAGVATAAKHFPGLGRVRGNTDLVTRVVDSSTIRRDDALAGFAAATQNGVDMVMVSSAYYERIDPDRRAAYSRLVIQDMIRGDLGFTGVVISDDLAAPGVTDLPPGERALRFLRAGGDLVIVGDPRQLTAMVTAVRSAMRTDADFADRVRAAARRVVALKAARDLAEC